jgi:hypothetical protein
MCVLCFVFVKQRINGEIGSEFSYFFKHLSSKFLKDSNEKKIPCILILSLNAYNAHSLV